MPTLQEIEEARRGAGQFAWLTNRPTERTGIEAEVPPPPPEPEVQAQAWEENAPPRMTNLPGKRKGQLEPGNLDLENRPDVPNPDGGSSSVYSMGIGVDDKEYLIPLVSEDGRLMSEEEGIAEFKATGNHLGIFDSPDSATEYAMALHEQQAALGESREARLPEEDEGPASNFEYEFRKSLKDPEYQGYTDAQQMYHIGLLLESDPFLADKSWEAKELHYELVVDQMREEYEHGKTFAGQLGVKDTGGVVQKGYDLYEKWVPGSDMGPRAIKSFVGRGVGSSVSGFGTESGWLADRIEDTQEMISFVKDMPMKDPRALIQYLSTSKEKPDEGIVVDVLRQSEEDFKEQGRLIVDFADRIPDMEKSIHSIAELKEAKSTWDFAKKGTNLVMGTTVESFAGLTPALIMKKRLKLPMGIGMGQQFMKEQEDKAAELGVKMTNSEVIASAWVQGGLDSLFGLEGIAAKGMGKNILDRLLTGGVRRVAKRTLTGMGVEAGTEFMQNWINEQAPRWKRGEREFWNNLPADAKWEMAEAAILAAASVGPIEAYVSGKRGVKEHKVGKKLKKLMERSRLDALSPEERGAEGVTRAVLRPHGEVGDAGTVAEVRHQNVPEFMKDDKDMVDNFVQGRDLGIEEMTNAQKIEINHAEEMIREELAGVRPTPVTLEAGPHTQTLEAVAAHTRKLAKKLREEGDIEMAEMYEKGAASLTIVQPTNDADHDWMRELQAVTREIYGVDLQFYSSPEGPISAGGMFMNKGSILVKYKPKGGELVAGSVTLHELSHNLRRDNPVAFNKLGEELAKQYPELWQDAVDRTEEVQEDLAEDDKMTPDIMEEEKTAYFIQQNAKPVFLLMSEIGDLAKYEAQPRGIRKVFETVAEVFRKMLEASPMLQKLTKIKPGEIKDTPAGRRQVAKMARLILDALGEADTTPVEAKVKEEPLVEGPDVKLAMDVKVGDDIAISKGIGGTVVDVGVGPGSEILIEMSNGETHALNPHTKVKVRKVTKAPEPAPKPEPVKEPDVEPESVQARELEIGDHVQLTKDIRGVVDEARFNADGMIEIVFTNGDTHVIGARVKVRILPKEEAPEAPEPAPKPEPVKEPKAEPKAPEPPVEADPASAPELKVGPKPAPVVTKKREPTIELDEEVQEEEGAAPPEGEQQTLFSTPEEASAADEAAVEEIEASGAMASFEIELERNPTNYNEWAGVIKEDGKEVGDLSFRIQFQGTEDETIFFDWVGIDVDKEGNYIFPADQAGSFGTRNVLAMRDQLQEQFPDARWVAGLRVGGTHARSKSLNHDALIRIPIHSKTQRTRMGIKLPPARTQSDLLLIYGFEAFYGKAAEHWQQVDDQLGLDTELDHAEREIAEATYDLDPDVVFLELKEDEGLKEHLIDQAKRDDMDDVFSSTELLPDYNEDMKTWGATEWDAWGVAHEVENLGGMSALKAHGGTALPGGGIDGTFSYQELLWIKEEAINPEEVWTEEQHAQFQRKLARTLTPKEPDSMQALNNMVFSILSPSLNVSLNEVLYSIVRMRNAQEVDEWAARVPWDSSKGEVPSLEILSEAEREDFDQWLKEIKKFKPPAEQLTNPATTLREYYDMKIRHEFQLQAGTVGIGFRASLGDVAELAQMYKADNDWFLLGEGESWYAFVNRLSSQLNGVQAKVASFGAVWQDPLHAAIAAIDRHMAFMFREELFTTPDQRVAFEQDVLREWNKKRAKKGQAEFPPQSIDEIIQMTGGTGFVTKMLVERISRPVRTKHGISKDQFKWISEPKNLSLMSDMYDNALKFNTREAKRLDLGVFATQHLLWDRQRRKVEPHMTHFPGLYKLPHLLNREYAEIVKTLKDHGWTSKGKEWIVTKDGEREYRLKRARSAPPGSLSFASDDAPSHFERGTDRKPIVNNSDVDPLSSVDENSGPMFIIPDESWMGVLRQKFQDNFLRVGRMQKAIERAGGYIHDDIDPYLAELLYHGKAAGEVELFEKEYVAPLMKFLQKEKIDIEAFEHWLWAKHAKERNDHLEDVWVTRRKEHLTEEIEAIENEIEYKADQGGDVTTLRRRKARKNRELKKLEDAHVPNSGMTTEDAAKVIEAAGTQFDKAGAMFRKLMDRKLAILFEGGLISEQQLHNVSTYKNYVPLKGKNYEGDLETLLDDNGAGTGNGFDIRGDELGFSFGRGKGDAHTHPIISQAVVDIETSIIRVEKNEIGKAMLGLVEEFPNPDVYEISKRVRRRVWDRETGEAKLVADSLAKNKDNVLAVKRDGETFYITFKDARLASAVKNLGTGNKGWPIKIAAAANRFLARINTTLNPEFMVSNFIRDLQTAMIHLNDEDAKGIAMETLGNLPAAMQGITAAEFKDSTEGWAGSYRDFIKAGGKIGGFGYNDVVSKAKALEKLVHRAGPGAKNMTFRGLRKLLGTVEAANTIVENGIRLATFETARRNGMTDKRAAALARRLTVNFNKKGEYGSTLNAVWLFSNASIQGTARMIQAVSSSRRVQAIASAQFMMSFVLAMFNRGAGGDDEEDGHSYWEKLPDWQKETNLIFMLPGTEGNHIKIPMGYGYNIFSVLGVEAEKQFHAINTGTFKKEDIPKGAVNILDSFLGAFNPLGSTRLDSSWGTLRFAVPSVAAPIADSLRNETYYGAPIQPNRSSWDKAPKSQRYFRGVSEISKGLTNWANEATGGNAYQPGLVDANPEVLDYLVGSYTGAAAKTGVRILENLDWLVRSRDLTKIEANDVAFLRRVYGEENGHTVASMFYENVEEIQQAKEAWENLGKLKGFDRSGWRQRHGWKGRLFDALGEAQRAISKQKDPEKKDAVRKRFNKMYRKAWLSQF